MGEVMRAEASPLRRQGPQSASAKFRCATNPEAPASAGATVKFAGYAAVFDAPDRGGDVVRRGAFAGVAREVPLLWQHRGGPVGRVRVLGEDVRGLRVVGEVGDPTLAAAVRSGAVAGLSFGYRLRRGTQGTYRELIGLELIEVSLVAEPMQPLARVLAGWTPSGWRFLRPSMGWTAWVLESGLSAQFDGVGWAAGVLTAARIDIEGTQIIAAQQPMIENPAGGTIVDSEARAAILGVLNALRAHGLIAS